MFESIEDILYIIDPIIFVIQMVVLVGLLLLALFWPSILKRMAPTRRVSANVAGFFPEVDDAAESVRRLREAGFAGDDLTVLSAIPYPEGAFGTDVGKSRILPFAFAGGIFGALFGVLLVAGTSLAYPLPTGGKPIVPIPVVLVITYELTVLSVVLFSLFRFLFEARLPALEGRLYDPRVSEGMVGIVVACETEEKALQAEEILSALGAEEVRRTEETISALGAMEPRRAQGRVT